MKKRILSIILALCMIFTLLPVSALAAEAATSGSCGKNATWSYADGTLTISGTGELKQYDGDNPAPWSAYKSEIKSIVIQDGITTVTESCFEGSVETVSFGSTVKISGRNPFVYLNDLKSVTVSEKNTAYCAVDGVLYNKSMTTLIAYPAAKDGSSFTVPGTVKTVGDSAFSECNKLTSITLPGSMTKIDVYAFYYCQNLKSITMPKKLDSIGDHAFAGCQSLAEMTVPEGVTVIENGTFYGCGSMKKLSLPVSLAEIKGYAVVRCDKLTDINYSGTKSQWQLVKVDGSNDCLRKATLHYGTLKVTTPTISITTSAGKPTISWTKIVGADKYWIYRSTDGKNFKYYDTTKNTSYKNSSTKIGTTYYYKIKAVTVSDGENVTSAYSNTKSIKCRPAAPSLSISRVNGKPKLSWKAVDGASKYWIYRSTDGVNYKYYDTTTKTGYTNTGASVGTTYYYKVKAVAVVNGSNVASAYSPAVSVAVPDPSMGGKCGDNVSWKISGNTLYISGTGKMYDYDGRDGSKNKAPWKKSFSSVVISDGVESIGAYAFSERGSISVTIPGSVKTIGDRAFMLCSFSKITIPEGVEKLGEGAFMANENLRSVTLPSTLRSIGDKCFSSCMSLGSITLPEGLWSIGDRAFENTSLKTLAIPASVKDIGANLCAGCEGFSGYTVSDDSPYYCVVNNVLYSKDMTRLVSYTGNESQTAAFTVPEGVKTIDDYAFYKANLYGGVSFPASLEEIGDDAFYEAGLLSVTLPAGLKSIGASAFAYCGNLKTVAFSGEVEKIGNWAFKYCSALTDITMPTKLGELGEEAFDHCSALTGVAVPEGVESIGDYTFSGCRALKSVTLPSTLKEIGEAAFKGCTALSGITLPTGLKTIGAGAFRESGLVGIVIPEGVTAIPNCCFTDCYRLASVTIPVSVKSIGSSAFIPGDGDAMKINYRGTKAQWKQISVGMDNPKLDKAIVVCDYK